MPTRLPSWAPSWIIPYSFLGMLYHSKTVLLNRDKVRHFLELADQVDTTAAHSNPFHMMIWGEYYSGTGRTEEAEQQFKKIIHLDSTNPVAHGTLGRFYFDMGRHAEAEVYLKKAIELDSTHWSSYNSLGINYFFTGQYAEAEVYLKKGQQLDSTSLWPSTVMVAGLYKYGSF